MAQEVADFLCAVEANDLEAVKGQLRGSAQLARATAPDGGTALHTAADLGHVFIIHQLVEANADLNAVDSSGTTPLMRSAWKAQLEAMEALLDLKADVNASNEAGATALHYAARSGPHPNVVELLLCRQAQPAAAATAAGTPLHWAVEAGEIGPTSALLEANKGLLDAADSAGRTPLHASVASDRPDLTLFLLERDANPNSQTEDGRTPLHIAVSDNKLEALKHLLTFGAQLLPDREGTTPLQLAEQRGARDAVRELQKKQTGGYDLSEEKRVQSMEKFKAQGNKVFEAGECSKSAKFYTLAISFQPHNHVLFSNRSASYYNLRRLYHALADASHCVALKPDWPKGYFRKGATLVLLERFAEAKTVLEQGLRLDPKNNDLRNAMKQLEKAQAKAPK